MNPCRPARMHNAGTGGQKQSDRLAFHGQQFVRHWDCLHFLPSFLYSVQILPPINRIMDIRQHSPSQLHLVEPLHRRGRVEDLGVTKV